MMVRVQLKGFACFVFLSLSRAQSLDNADFQPEYDEEPFQSTNGSCVNGHWNSDLICECDPCWQGSSCLIYVDYYAPRFLVHKSTAVVPFNVTGDVFRAWSSDEDLGLTCPLGPGVSARCPCAAVRYQLFSPPGDHNFVIHPHTGILSRSANGTQYPLQERSTYVYKIMVQNIPVKGFTEDLAYDILDLDIFVGSPYVKKIPWT